MGDKRGQPGRVLDLARYVPDFLQEVKEFRQLYGAQEDELKRLYGDVDSLWKDSLIPEATMQGIKRYELMLGLKPYPGDTLEERRAAVALKWNQQLPYTFPRLKERLEAIVGNDGYVLWVRGKTYELELWIVEQPCRVLQEFRDMTRQMIPANLLFIFAGLYPIEIPANTAISGRLELISDFYARYNREFLYLDGTWDLDGTYLLNGYKEAVGLELYPLELKLRSSLPVRNTADTKTQMTYRSDAAASSGTWTELILRSEEAAATVTESAVRISQQVSAESEVMCRLSVEKDLWYLDGTYLLDGTKLLDAEIFNYDL